MNKMYLLTWEFTDMPSDHYLFSTKQKAINKIYELIGNYIVDCIKEHDFEAVIKYVNEFKEVNEDSIVLDGEEFYIEEIEVDK